jgi:hypothetical protein
MAITFGFFFDSALTQPVSSGDPIPFSFEGAGSGDVQLWFGSLTSSVKVQATSNPGTDSITITPTDSDSGTGEPNTAIKLATSQGALTAATAGASLAIGTTINSSTGSAFPFWARITNALTTVGVYTDLSLATNDLTETAQ